MPNRRTRAPCPSWCLDRSDAGTHQHPDEHTGYPLGVDAELQDGAPVALFVMSVMPVDAGRPPRVALGRNETGVDRVLVLLLKGHGVWRAETVERARHGIGRYTEHYHHGHHSGVGHGTPIAYSWRRDPDELEPPVT
jgi:hypothetical protein